MATAQGTTNSADLDGMVYLPRYDNNNGCAYPHSCVVGPRQVVSAYDVNDGANALRTYSVKYRDGRFDYGGRGFLGFGARIVLDGGTNGGVADFYDNVTKYTWSSSPYGAYAYPYLGTPKRSLFWTPGGVFENQLEITLS